MYSWEVRISWQGRTFSEHVHGVQDITGFFSVLRAKYPGCVIVSHRALR